MHILDRRKHTKFGLVAIIVISFQYGQTFHCPDEQGGWILTDLYVVKGFCCAVTDTPVSFDRGNVWKYLEYMTDALESTIYEGHPIKILFIV